jgi:hypothetical protein
MTFTDGVRRGEHYIDPQAGLTLLCTRPGTGTLTHRGQPMMLVQDRRYTAKAVSGL